MEYSGVFSAIKDLNEELHPVSEDDGMNSGESEDSESPDYMEEINDWIDNVVLPKGDDEEGENNCCGGCTC